MRNKLRSETLTGHCWKKAPASRPQTHNKSTQSSVLPAEEWAFAPLTREPLLPLLAFPK